MPTSSEIIQRRSLFAAQGTRRYKRSGCIGFGDRFTSESVIGIPRIAQSLLQISARLPAYRNSALYGLGSCRILGEMGKRSIFWS